MEIKDWIIVFGIFIAAGFTAYQYYDGVMSGKKNEVLTNKLLDKTTELAEANKKNEELQGQINDKASQIIESNQKLIDAQAETIHELKGNGFTKIYFSGHEDNYLVPIIKNPTQYTQRNVEFTIVNFTSFDCDNIIEGNNIIYETNCLKKFTQGPSVGRDFPSGSESVIEDYHIPFVDGIYYFYIKVKSLNITTFQYSIVEIKNVNGVPWFKHYYRIYEYNNDHKQVLLDKDNGGLNEEHFKAKFPYKKNIQSRPILHL